MTHDSAMRELHEEMTDDQLALGRQIESSRGKVGPAFSESLRRGLASRRLLMVASDAATGDAVEDALRQAGMRLQRVTAADPIRTETVDGIVTTPLGEVVVVDAEAFNAIHDGQSPALADTANAITAIVASTQIGSAVDHLMMVTPQEAMRSALATLNAVMDRFVEAELVDHWGGMDRLPAHVRAFLPWVPKRHRDQVAIVGGRADEALRLAAALADAGDPGIAVIDVGSDRHSDDDLGPDGYKMDMRPFDRDPLDGIFGSDIFESRRRERSTYVLRAESSIARMACKVMAAGLVEREGFNHRDENDAWNRRQGRRSKGDRRMNRGGKGRR